MPKDPRQSQEPSEIVLNVGDLIETAVFYAEVIGSVRDLKALKAEIDSGHVLPSDASERIGAMVEAIEAAVRDWKQATSADPRGLNKHPSPPPSGASGGT